MRLNLREKSKKIKINYSNEMLRIDNLFSKSKIIQYFNRNDAVRLYPQYTTIEKFFNSCMFIKYPYADRFINIYDMRISLGISSDDINKNNINIMLDYFEFIFNIMKYFLYNYKQYNISFDGSFIEKICSNMHNVLDRLNYETSEIDEYIHIVEKDATSTAVAEIYEDISDKVIEYRRYDIKGDIDRKCDILNRLAKKFEVIRNDLKANNFGEIEDKTGSMLNNLDIRHNNNDGKNAKKVIQNMSNKELEQWYDKTYDLLLLCFMLHHYLDFRDDIKDLNKKLKNKV